MERLEPDAEGRYPGLTESPEVPEGRPERVNGPSGRLRWSNVAWVVGLGLCLLLCAATLALALGSFLDPASSLYAMVCSFAWPLAGPQLTLLSLVCLFIAAVAAWRGPHILGLATVAVAVISSLASAGITGRTVEAISDAGGTANPLTALWWHGMGAAPDSTVTYEHVAGQQLTALLYKPPHTAGAAPVIMYIHGGGWIQGSASDAGHDLRWFADHGYLVVSVNYRLATPTQPTWNKAPRDVACALTWVHRYAARYGGNPQRIIVAGDSTGGNLAVNLAYSAALGRARSGCGGQVPTPQAVMVQYPAVEPLDVYQHGYPVPGFEPQMFIDRYLGGTPGEVPDRLKAISSTTYLSAKAPPTLIIEPSLDGLVPTDGVLNFAETARAAGVRVRVHQIPDANHDYDETFAGTIGNQAGLTIRLAYLSKLGLTP